jgi:hypothetical protein
MKKTAALFVAVSIALASPVMAPAAQHDHGSMKLDQGSMSKGHGGMMGMGKIAHEEVIGGVKATFSIMDMREHAKAMKTELPKGMKETHHVMVSFIDVKTGKPLTEGQVKVKVQGPGKVEQVKDLVGMEGHFGADFNLSVKGKYGIMAKFVLKDGKVRTGKFWYESR